MTKCGAFCFGRPACRLSSFIPLAYGIVACKSIISTFQKKQTTLFFAAGVYDARRRIIAEESESVNDYIFRLLDAVDDAPQNLTFFIPKPLHFFTLSYELSHAGEK